MDIQHSLAIEGKNKLFQNWSIMTTLAHKIQFNFKHKISNSPIAYDGSL